MIGVVPILEKSHEKGKDELDINIKTAMQFARLLIQIMLFSCYFLPQLNSHLVQFRQEQSRMSFSIVLNVGSCIENLQAWMCQCKNDQFDADPSDDKKCCRFQATEISPIEQRIDVQQIA